MNSTILCVVVAKQGRRGTTGEVQAIKLRRANDFEGSSTFSISIYGPIRVGQTIAINSDRIKYSGV
jgi:ribosomal protein S28E/S33